MNLIPLRSYERNRETVAKTYWVNPEHITHLYQNDVENQSRVCVEFENSKIFLYNCKAETVKKDILYATL